VVRFIFLTLLDETQNLIEMLVNIAPEWCSLIKSEFGILVKIDPSVPRKDVMAAVLRKLNG
jgi:hypothetical protein